jgi:signal transduction histidine kinase
MKISQTPILKQDTITRALELGGVGVVILDRDSEVEWMSAEARNLFGIVEDSDQAKIVWRDLIQIEGKSVWNDELEKQYKIDGFLKTEGYCDAPGRGRIAIELVMYRDRHSLERFILIRDITYLKQHEIDLKEEKRNADQLNRALEREIQKANELAVMAERANIAKSVFLTSMSHEFRTPLNGVLGYSQILSRDSSLNSKNKKAIATIEKCGRHLLSLINDVLDLSKIEAGKIIATRDPINIKTIVNDIIDVFKVRAQAKGIELNCVLDQKMGHFEWISGDSRLLRQVLINLIGNAIKFTDQGVVILRVQNLGKLKKNSDTHSLRFSVEDTGLGIEKSYLEQVFEEFYQTEAFSGHKGGTGLGLAISRKLVACMGGELKVDSKVGKGSQFWFDLPTKLVSHPDQNEGKQSRVEHIRVKAAQAHYLQLFSGEVDSGVMRRIFTDLGFQTSLIEELSLAVLEPLLEKTPVLAVAITSDSLWSEQVDGVRFLLEQELGEQLFWVVYMSGNKRDELRTKEILGSSQYSCVEIPINPQSLLDDLYRLNPDLWDLDINQADTNGKEKTPTGTDLIDEVPPLEILNVMRFDAQIGDIRAFNDKLSKWEKRIENTVFSRNVSGMMESFRIDELCQYLNKLIQSHQEES